MAEMKLDLSVDSRKAVKGVDDFADALDDVTDELDKAGKAGKDTGDDISDGMREAARDTDRAADSMQDDLVDSFRRISRESKDTSQDVKRSFKDGFDGAKNEASQSAREGAASFAGEFDDVADFVQESLANALEGFGPAGAAAGVALAIGIGAGLQALAKEQERIEEVRDAARDIAQAMYENNGQVPLDERVDRLFDVLSGERRTISALEDFVNDWKDLGTQMDSVRRVARDTDIKITDLMRGLSGDGDAARTALKEINDQLAEMQDLARENAGNAGFQVDTGLLAQLQSNKKALEDVIEQARIADQVLGEVGAAYDSDTYVQEVREIGTAWQDAATDASDYFTESEDGATQFDWSAYTQGLKDEIDAANTYKAELVGLPETIQTEAKRIFDEQGAGNAAAFIEAYKGATATEKQSVVDSLTSIGKESGEGFANAAESAARSTAQGLGPIPMGVKASLDTSEVDNYVPPSKTVKYYSRIIQAV